MDWKTRYILWEGSVMRKLFQTGNVWSSLILRREGFEYHLLVIAICITLLISGGGKWSVGRAIVPNPEKN